jgi:magnesium-transporting ATPase (P-type)
MDRLAGNAFNRREMDLLNSRSQSTELATVVLLAAVMGYIQESRAEQAVAALRQMSGAHASSTVSLYASG